MSTVKNRLVISFIVAWIAYALTYFLRKPLGVVRYLGNTFFTSYLFDYLDQDRS
jgi:sugar phosphate permease